jgi:hypothetical protein
MRQKNNSSKRVNCSSVFPIASIKTDKKSKTVLDTHTPVLDRYEKDEVVPFTEIIQEYLEVDQELGKLLGKATTIREVREAFLAQPYGCFSGAINSCSEEKLYSLIASELRSVKVSQIGKCFTLLPRFLQIKVWSLLLPVEKRMVVKFLLGVTLQPSVAETLILQKVYVAVDHKLASSLASVSTVSELIQCISSHPHALYHEACRYICEMTLAQKMVKNLRAGNIRETISKLALLPKSLQDKVSKFFTPVEKHTLSTVLTGGESK